MLTVRCLNKFARRLVLILLNWGERSESLSCHQRCLYACMYRMEISYISYCRASYENFYRNTFNVTILSCTKYVIGQFIRKFAPTKITRCMVCVNYVMDQHQPRPQAVYFFLFLSSSQYKWVRDDAWETVKKEMMDVEEIKYAKSRDPHTFLWT